MGKISREEETKLINAALSKVSNGKKHKVAIIAKRPVFKQVARRERIGSFNQFSEGLCYDEAKTRCGNSEVQLEDAVSTVRCVKVGKGCKTAYFFRKVTVGVATNTSRSGEMKLTGKSTTGMMEGMDRAIGSMVVDRPAFAGLPGESLAATFPSSCVKAMQGPGTLQLTDIKMAARVPHITKLRSKLGESRQTLEKTLKLADRCRHTYLPMTTGLADGNRLARALEELQATCEAADATGASATRGWNLGKDEQGKPVTTDGYASTTKKVDDDKDLILADIKTFRANVPKIMKETDAGN